VHTLAVGLGRTGAGLGRTRHVFRSSQYFQGLEPGSSPTSGSLPVRQPEFEGVKLPQGHRRGPHEGDVGGFRTLAWSAINVPDAGQKSGDRRHRGDLPTGEGPLNGGFVIDRARTVVPPVGLHLLAHPDQLVDDFWLLTVALFDDVMRFHTTSLHRHYRKRRLSIKGRVNSGTLAWWLEESWV